MNNSFTSSDYINAKESFINWQGKISESVDSYILRQRKAELRELVKRVVKNELSDYDRIIVNLRWYENYTTAEIAEKLGAEFVCATGRKLVFYRRSSNPKVEHIIF